MMATTTKTITIQKELWILRHGQAMHNVRAEVARAGGCTFDEFFQLMKEDDSLDCPLTELGQQQAQSVYEQYFRRPCPTSISTPLVVTPSTSSVSTTSSSSLSSLLKNYGKNSTIRQRQYPNIVISSPLSRAIQTADIALPDNAAAKRIGYEGFREVNGLLYNAKRRTKSELQSLYPHWDWNYIDTEKDILWDPTTLETHYDCAIRGLHAFEWLCQLQIDKDNDNSNNNEKEEQQRIL